MSLPCVCHSVSPSHLFICIATLSPLPQAPCLLSLLSLSSASISTSPFPFSPFISHVVIPHPIQPSLTLSAVRSKQRDVWYLTHHWSCWSAPSKVLLADWQRLVFARAHIHAHTQIYMYCITQGVMTHAQQEIYASLINDFQYLWYTFINIFALFLSFLSPTLLSRINF